MDEYQTQQFWKKMDKEKFTYRQLKDILNALTDEQLDESIYCASEIGGGIVNEVWIVEEDQINPSGEGMEPISHYMDENGNNLDEYFDANKESIVCKKGTVVLLMDVPN